MDSKFSITNPDEVVMTLTVTMKLQYWKKLQAELSDSTLVYPASSFYDKITDMVRKAERSFHPDEPKP